MTKNDKTDKKDKNEKSVKKEAATLSSKTVVFVATYPDRVGQTPPYLELIDRQPGVVMLHPGFNFNNDVGQKVLNNLSSQNVPGSNNHWDNMMQKDFFCVEQSDLLIYDLDIEPGHQFLAAAGIFKKPVIGVSEVFKSISPYFSGITVGVVKHAELVDFMKYVINHKKLFKKIKNDRTEKTEPNPETVQMIKEKIDSAMGR